MVSTANLLIQTADRFNRQLKKVWAEHPPLCQKKPGILPCDAGKPCPLGLSIVVESDSERGAMHCQAGQGEVSKGLTLEVSSRACTPRSPSATAPSQAERIPRAHSALEECCQHRKVIKEELIKETI